MHPYPPIQPQGTFDGLRPASILLGAVVDVIATTAASALLVAWLSPEALSGDEQAASDAIARLNGSPEFVVGTLALGSLCTVLGAFVGARRAGQLHVRHGGWIAVASTALSLVMMLGDPGTAAEDPTSRYPLWAEALGWLLILPSGMAGGALARAAAQKNA